MKRQAIPYLDRQKQQFKNQACHNNSYHAIVINLSVCFALRESGAGIYEHSFENKPGLLGNDWVI
jgi:hypothetical protein